GLRSFDWCLRLPLQPRLGGCKQFRRRVRGRIATDALVLLWPRQRLWNNRRSHLAQYLRIDAHLRAARRWGRCRHTAHVRWHIDEIELLTREIDLRLRRRTIRKKLRLQQKKSNEQHVKSDCP